MLITENPYGASKKRGSTSLSRAKPLLSNISSKGTTHKVSVTSFVQNKNYIQRSLIHY